jgi:hypothetical protein
MRERGGMCCVPILAPSTSIYSAKAGLGRTNEVVTCGAEDWGQVGESSMRRSCRLSNGYLGRHLALPLVRHDKPTCGSVVQGLRVGID